MSVSGHFVLPLSPSGFRFYRGDNYLDPEGFSQGGAVAYLSALTHPVPLAGIVALSTYIPSARLLVDELTEANRQIPVFAAHGTQDDVVALELGTQALGLLQTLGLEPEWHTYDMPHSVCLQEVADIGAWIKALVGGAR